MKFKRKRQLDINLYPKSHLRGILRQNNEKPTHAIKRGVGTAFRTLGHVVVFPLVIGNKFLRRGLNNTRLRFSGEEDSLFPNGLEYYKPQLNIVGPSGMQLSMPMDGAMTDLQNLPRPKREQMRKRSRKVKKKVQSKSTESNPQGIMGSFQVRIGTSMEGAIDAPAVLPHQEAIESDDATRKRQDAGTKAKLGTRQKHFLLMVGILIACAAFGLFSWYMLFGRYCVISVIDDGVQRSVRTKEDTLQEVFVTEVFNLTPEDLVSLPLQQEPQEGMTVTITRARNISIEDGDQTKTVRLAQGTIDNALQLAGVAYTKDDEITPAVDTPIGADTNVEIIRAKAIHIKTKKKSYQVMLATGTVGDALTKAGLVFDKQDQISPSIYTHIKDGMEISFTSVDVKKVSHTETIGFETIKKKDKTINRGTTKVSQQGKEGVRTIVEEVKYEDGVEVSRKTVSDKITTKAVNKIILEGTKVPVNPAVENLPKGGPTKSMIKTTMVIDQITAYTHTGKRTATGKWPMVGMCAVNPKLIPYGTKLYIPGYGYAVAEDTGANNADLSSIDVFMDTYEECIRWGRKRNRTVYILK